MKGMEQRCGMWNMVMECPMVGLVAIKVLFNQVVKLSIYPYCD